MNEKGTVKAYLQGFGFIKGENGKDVFFHIKHFSGKKTGRVPKEGDILVFNKTSAPKGFIAEPWAFADELTDGVEKKSLHQEIGVDFGIPHPDKKEKKSRHHGKRRDRYDNNDDRGWN
jgi:cold shock CspA family protein